MAESEPDAWRTLHHAEKVVLTVEPGQFLWLSTNAHPAHLLVK